MTGANREQKSRSLVQRVQQHVEADAAGVGAGVSFALERLVVLKRATDVVRREDHGVAIAKLDPFQVRLALTDQRLDRAIAAALRLAAADARQVIAAKLL